MRIGLAQAALCFASAVGLLVPARAEQSTGSITGTVTLTAVRGLPSSTSVYGRRGVAPKPAVAGPETRNVVVHLVGQKSIGDPAPVRARIAQRGEQFVPSVVAIPVGSTVDFPNEDPFFHNVFSLSKVATFDLGRYPSGEIRSRQFVRPGIVKVFCHLHSQMNALIVVLDHPWFTTPAETGLFTLPDIPAGDHTVAAWHERVGERRERVRVMPGQATRVSFTLPVLDEAER
jgi:plastocyanin